jgi:DNA repair exonuclease SbcCD ATPase subunit
VSPKAEAPKPARNIDPVEFILEAVREEMSESGEVVDAAATGSEDISESIETCGQSEIEIIDDLPEFTGEFAEIEEASREESAVRNDGVQLGILAEQAKSRRLWQGAAIFLFVFLFASVFAVLWFYMDRQIQLDRLDSAYTSIQKVYNDLKEANLYSEGLQSGLDDSRAELERLRGELSSLKARAELAQNESEGLRTKTERLRDESNDFKARAVRLEDELNSSRAELKEAQSELARARKELDSIQQYNSEAVEKLNEQIQDLSGRLAELSEGY